MKQLEKVREGLEKSKDRFFHIFSSTKFEMINGAS